MMCAKKPASLTPFRYFADFIDGRRGEILDAALVVFGEKGYEAGTMREIAGRVATEGDVIRVAVLHRVGHLQVGEIAVVVAVSASHRSAALEACHALIDAVKATAPIWKHQIFQDGSDEWVGTP